MLFALVMTGVPGAMVMVTAFVPVPAGLVACTVTGNEPLTVGVPEMRPVFVSTVTPVGSAPTTL